MNYEYHFLIAHSCDTNTLFEMIPQSKIGGWVKNIIANCYICKNTLTNNAYYIIYRKRSLTSYCADYLILVVC